MVRRLLLSSALALCLLAPGAAMAQQAEPAVPAQVRTQVPGYYRLAVGSMEVTALYDGYIDLKTALLKGIQGPDLDRLLTRMFVDGKNGIQTAVNGFLIHTGQRLVLVDTGTAAAFGPTLGFIPSHIRAAGYDLGQIDTILLTHLHPDHVNGLLNADGSMAFPNATVLVAQAESEYWLGADALTKAPEAKRPFFAMAQKAVAPYQAAGRLQTFIPGQEVVPGITSVAAKGHTPGHSGFQIGSGSSGLLLWGDVVHSFSVQFSRPDVSLEFDENQPQAIATRKALFAETAKSKILVGGAHLPFPGLGHVRQDGKSYSWVPVEYSPLRSDRPAP